MDYNKEMEELMEKIRIEKHKLRENQRICNHITKHLHHESISNQLAEKVRNIFITHELGDNINLNANTNLLGIANPPEISLTYNDKQSINNLFQIKPLNEETIESFECNDKLTLETRCKLNDVIGLYYDNLLKKNDLLHEVVDFRKNYLPKICLDKTEEARLKIEANKHKMKIVNEKFRIDMLMEIPVAINAYKMLLNDIKEEQIACEREYKELLEFKDKYKIVRSKEYEEILKSYLAYMNSIDSKKEMFDKLNLKY